MRYFRNFIIALFSTLFVMTGCVDDFKVGNNFLEKEPGVDVTIDTIFGKAEYARRFLWNTYSGMYYGLPWYWETIGGKMNMGIFEALSDCWHSHLDWDGVNRMYYSGSYSAGMEDSDAHTRWGYSKEGTWETIRKGWIFIENVDKVPDMDASEKQKLKGEAKVIIVTRYFDMFRHLGGLPIVDHAWDVNESTINARATVEETVDFMVNLLDEAAEVLPWALEESEIQNWDGRFTAASAKGLKCKVLLFAASPLFNDSEPYSNEQPQEAVDKRQVWYGGYKPELWSQTLEACRDFFEDVQSKGRYGLYVGSDYRTSFRNAYSLRGSGGDNPELLISTRIRYNYWSDYEWNYYFPQSCINGAFTPTQEFVEMFPMSDGTPFDWNNPDHVERMFTDRDPRLYETVLVNGADYQGRKAELWVGGREATTSSKNEEGQFATGYANYKYILDYNTSRGKATLWPYLRISEVHLIYAEALMKEKRFEEAIAEVDKVRARVGMNGLRESNPGLNLNSETVLLKEILRERACELGLEDVRLFDIIRNKLKENMTTQLHGLRIYRADGLEQSWSDLSEDKRGDYPTEFIYERFELVKPKRRYLWVEGNFSPKWYLAAFPPAEINKKYGLTQNPGW